jgi:hypothetical protein
MRETNIEPEKVATRVMKGLVTMRSAAVKLHAAGVNRQETDVRAALSTIDQEYYSLRDYLSGLVEDQQEKPVD